MCCGCNMCVLDVCLDVGMCAACVACNVDGSCVPRVRYVCVCMYVCMCVLMVVQYVCTVCAACAACSVEGACVPRVRYVWPLYAGTVLYCAAGM